MSEGSETDPQARMAELQKRRDEIDAEIARVLAGDMPTARRHRAEGPLPAVHAAGARTAHRFSRGGAQLSRAGPPRARTHRAVGRQQGRAAGGDHGRARRHRRFRPGQQLSRLLGFSDVEQPPGGADATAGARAVLAAVAELKPDPRTPARPLRLAGGRRAHPAHGGPALAAVAPFSGRPGLAGEPSHHGHSARHRGQGPGAAGRSRPQENSCRSPTQAPISNCRWSGRCYAPPIKPLIADSVLEPGDEDLDAAALFSPGRDRQGGAGAAHPPCAAGPLADHPA